MATLTTPFNSTPPVRRSFTLPTQSRRTSSPASPAINLANPSTDARGLETLFAHPHARIAQFPANTPGSTQKEGTLPWTKPNERIAAVGAMHLYKLPEHPSAYLTSGDVLLSLMPRSQCWCVDGVSKFAFRILPNVWRIELPYETDQDRACVEDFKIALGKVLFYERTACPFKRHFATEVTEEVVSPLPVSRLARNNSKAKRWSYDGDWRLEGTERPAPLERRPFVLRKTRRRRSRSSSVSDRDGGLSNANSHETLSTQPTSAFAEGEPYVAGQVKKLESARPVLEQSDYFEGANTFSGHGDVDGDEEEQRELHRDVAPASVYVPLGAVTGSLSKVQADEAASASTSRDDGVLDDRKAGSRAPFGPPASPHSHLLNHRPEDPDPPSGSNTVNKMIEPYAMKHTSSSPQQQTPPSSQNLPSSPALHESLPRFASATPELEAPRGVEGTMPSSQPTSGSTAATSSQPPNQDQNVSGPLQDQKTNHSVPSTAIDLGEMAAEPAESLPSQPTASPALSSAPNPVTTSASLHNRSPKSAKPSTPPSPPSSPPSTIKPRASQMLRDFRSRRPSTPSKRSTATARGLGYDVDNAPYLGSDPLPSLPYGGRDQGMVGATLGLLLGPPAGLMQVMMQIAARIASTTSALAAATGEIGDLTEIGEAYYKRHNGRWVPGGWESSDDGSEDGSTVEGAAETVD